MYLGDTSQMVPSHIGYYHKCDIIACIFTSNDQYTITCDEEGFIRLINTGTGFEIFLNITFRACERLLITRARVTRLITVRKDTLLDRRWLYRCISSSNWKDPLIYKAV